MAYFIGVDTGGTFTDVVAIDEKSVITTAKALSTPPRFEDGIMNALQALAEEIGITREKLLRETARLSLGTTVATNTLITGTGAKAGLLITVGFEDTLHIGRGISKWIGLPESQIKDYSMASKPEPYIPKELIRGITERIDWKGSIVCPLNREEVKQAVKALVDKGVEAIAVCFLWSFKNPAHENEVGKIISELYPDLFISLSSEITPILGDYERCNTVVLNAYVGPTTKEFITKVDEDLKTKGLSYPMLVMQCSGGTTFGSSVTPAATFESGPAGGVIGSRFIGEQLGLKNIITTDVGGTSFDVSVIADGAVMFAREPVVERQAIALPLIDVASIGAGGGSIAWADPSTGLIHVGPKSATARPGPACYGFGGTEPTVTDACLVLGYLDPDYFLGGKMKLYPDKALDAIKKVADQAKLDVTRVAAGTYDIVCSHMADLIRITTVQRGYDPRDFVLFAFGGAGPAHAAVYGAELGVKEVIIPSAASTYSALGIATSDILHTNVLYDSSLIPMGPDRFNKNFQTLEERVKEDLNRDGVKEKDRTLRYFLEMKYGSQIHVLRVLIPTKRYRAEDMDFIANEFDKVYESVYGKGSGYSPAGRFVTTFIVEGFGKVLKPPLLAHKLKGRDASAALMGKRDAFFKKHNDYVPTNIYNYDKLQAGNIVEGPAIIEATKTTIVVPPDQKARMDEYLNIRI